MEEIYVMTSINANVLESKDLIAVAKGAQEALYVTPLQEDITADAAFVAADNEPLQTTVKALPSPWKHPFYRQADGTWFVRMAKLGYDIPVSRDYVRLMLDKEISLLSDDEQGDLESPTVMALVRERFQITQNLTLENVELLAADDYKHGRSPMPWIRKALTGICEITDRKLADTPFLTTLLLRHEADGKVSLREVWFGKDQMPVVPLPQPGNEDGDDDLPEAA
jgi:hypothetical protein